jgi:hypothetical protein
MTAPQLDRPRFYEQQYLGSSDLTAVVDYSRVRLARHVLGGHTWGIAMGLDLVAKDSPTAPGTKDVLIQPGFAWDGFGRPIVLLAPCRLAAAMFQDILFDPAVPNGTSVPVWLRYDESLTGEPASGYDACDVESQFSRVEESYRVEVGARSADRQRAKLDVAGRAIDATAALSTFDATRGALWDASVPQQNFPEDGTTGDWLVPIGMVHWQPDADPSIPGQLSLTPAEAIPSEQFRRYAGVVAGAVFAMGSNTRFRRREVAPSTDWSTDLVWIEGALRVQGGARLFGCALDFLTTAGQDAGVPLRISRPQQLNALGGQDLVVQIGSKASDPNRLLVGPSGAGNERLIVFADGKVGVGSPTPTKSALTVRGRDTAEELLGFESAAGTLTWHINQKLSGANPPGLNFAETAVADGRLFLQKGGRVGVNATDPTNVLDVRGALGIRQEQLHISGGTPSGWSSVSFNAHHNAINTDWVIPDPTRTAVTIEMDDTAGFPRFEVWATTSGDMTKSGWRQRLAVNGETGDVYLAHNGGSVGIGTNAPTAKLDVRGSVKLGAIGNLYAPGCLDDLRFIAGHVGSDGSIQFGSGFIVGRNATGNYTVTYMVQFSGIPVVLATPYDPGGSDNTISIVDSTRFSFTIDIRDTNQDTDEDDDFNFVVFGTK